MSTFQTVQVNNGDVIHLVSKKDRPGESEYIYTLLLYCIANANHLWWKTFVVFANYLAIAKVFQ